MTLEQLGAVLGILASMGAVSYSIVVSFLGIKKRRKTWLMLCFLVFTVGTFKAFTAYNDFFAVEPDRVAENQDGSSTDTPSPHDTSAEVSDSTQAVASNAAPNSTTPVDGNVLFSDTITAAERINSATKQLAESLSELPALLKVEVQGKPEFDSKTSAVVVDLVLSADHKGYSDFVEKLEKLLGQISVSRISTVINSTAAKGHGPAIDGVLQVKSHPELMGPKLDAKTGTGCIWICTFQNATHTTTRWNGYIIEADLIAAAGRLQIQIGHKYLNSRHCGSNPKTMVTLSGHDSSGSVIALDEFEVLCDSDSTFSYGSGVDGSGLPFLRHFVIRSRNGRQSEGDSKMGLFGFEKERQRTGVNDASLVPNMYIAPYFFTVKTTGYGVSIHHKPRQHHKRRIKVSLEELKQLKEFRATINVGD